MNDKQKVKVPDGWEYCGEEFPCPKCHEEAVYGDWVDDMDYDVDEDGKEHAVSRYWGQFICSECGHQWTKG